MRPSRIAHRGQARVCAGARADKARQIEVKPRASETADAFIEALFEVRPTLESDLVELAAGQ